MTAPEANPIRLTQFSHGGGCGCKIAPGVLQRILAGSARGLVPPALMVGIETSDDAAVYRIGETQAIVATTDFFMPIVDDPHDFGAIAATNAISDIYAMGATPLFALALVAMPIKELPIEVIRAIVAGGESICAKAGIPIAGGHTIDSVEPIYGLAVIGSVHPDRVKRNCGARSGDALVLGKPLGVGVYSAALRKNALSPAAYRELIECTTKLNSAGIELGALEAVHAMTDVTGFGLLGHMLEMCRASDIAATVDVGRIPLLREARELAMEGYVTGASARNFDGYGEAADISAREQELVKSLLTDPQTSGGLLVACAENAVQDVLAIFLRKGFDRAATIGVMGGGPARVIVRE